MPSGGCCGVSAAKSNIFVQISDEGGGIPRSHYPKIFSYLYTTAKTDYTKLDDEVEDFGTQAPLAGMGCGLPLSRLYPF